MPTMPPKQRHGLPMTLVLLGAMGIALVCLVHRDIDRTNEDYTLVRVDILKYAWLDKAIWWYGFLCPLVLLVASAANFRKWFARYIAIFLVMALILFPLSCWNRIGDMFGPWTLHGEVVASDGTKYVFMDRSFMQGQTMALGRYAGVGLLYQHFDVLGTTQGDSPRSWASIVRPAEDVNAGYGQLYLSDASMLAGVRYDNHCFFAYDLNSHQFHGWDTAREISPFVLIGPGTPMHRPDASRIKDHMTKTIGARSGGIELSACNGVPSRKSLVDAQGHADPAVRELAAELLTLYDAPAP